MVAFTAFRALRYATADLDRLVAPPYDVLSDAEVDRLQSDSPHNITWVDVPRGGLDRYAEAARRLQGWLGSGVLTRDERASYTIYRLNFTDATGAPRSIAGVMGGLEVVDENAGGVLPHERTTPKATTDRLDLTRATCTNLSPVWGLSLARGLTDLLREPGLELARVVDDGVEHVVERVDRPDRVAAIRDSVAGADVLIADGHHRYAVSRTYRDEVRAATGRRDTAAEQTLAFINELAPDQLSVAAIHRVYRGLPAAELLAVLERRFEAAPADEPTPDTVRSMQEDGFLVLVGRERCWSLHPRPGAFEGLRPLDGLWLEQALADVSVEVSYQHGLSETVAAVRGGANPLADAAVLIRPVSVGEIERTAREGVLMPPKSTFFAPKLKTGLVLRPLT